MKLFGIAHQREHLDRQVTEIESLSCGTQGKVMMIELPPNYEKNVESGLLRPNFFMALRDHFRSRCSRIICGDQDLTIPEKPDWLLSVFLGEDYFYPDNHRDETMVSVVKREQPDIVAVGNGHSDNLKMHFPLCDYTVFVGETDGYTGRYGQPHIWHNPNRIISL